MIWYALANEASDKFSVSDNFFLLLLKKLLAGGPHLGVNFMAGYYSY